MPLLIPVLETSRLTIRPWRLDDASDMFEYSSDPLVARLAMWAPHASMEACIHDIQEAIEKYDARSWMYWGIEHRLDAKLIGSVGFGQWNQHDQRAELGFALNRTYWRQGIMREATDRVVRFGWENMLLHRIEARCIASNDASIHLLTKLGFEHEGVRKEAARVDDVFEDVIQWGLVR